MLMRLRCQEEHTHPLSSDADGVTRAAVLVVFIDLSWRVLGCFEVKNGGMFNMLFISS